MFDDWLILTGIEDRPYYEQPYWTKVYPNSTSGQITFEITTTNEIEKLNIQIVSATGQVVKELEYEKATVILSTADYPPGFYLFRVYPNNRILDAGKFNICQ